MTPINDRLTQLETIHEIRQAVAFRSRLVDRPYDADSLMTMYTEEGVIDSGAFGSFRGREQIHDFFASLPAKIPFTMHFKFCGQIDLSDGRGLAQGDWMGLETPIVEGDAVIGAIRDTNSYRHEDGRWLVAHYRQSVAFMAPYSQGWNAGISAAGSWDPQSRVIAADRPDREE